MRGRTGGCPPRGLLHDLGYMACRVPGPFVRPRLPYREGVVVFLQDGPELDGGEAPPHVQLHGAAIPLAESARANADDKLDF